MYYRLKTIDKNGRTEYSNTLHLKGQPARVLITPNVIKDNKLNIVTQTVYSRLEIIDMNGRTRLTINQRILPGSNNFGLKGLTSGAYFVRLSNGNEQVSQRIHIEQ